VGGAEMPLFDQLVSSKNLIGTTGEGSAPSHAGPVYRFGSGVLQGQGAYFGCNVVVLGPALDNRKFLYWVNRRIPGYNTQEAIRYGPYWFVAVGPQTTRERPGACLLAAPEPLAFLSSA